MTSSAPGLVTKHPHQITGAALPDVARMGAVEVIGDPPADPVELDAEDDLMAVRERLAFVQLQMLHRQHL
jgi:hypothetical protein